MKWFGVIAFADQVDDGTGIWEPKITERQYYGDLTKNIKRDQVEQINTDLTMSNTLSIVADPFLIDSFQKIEYVEIFGSKWRVSSVEVNYPRLTLYIGSLYKEDENG